MKRTPCEVLIIENSELTIEHLIYRCTEIFIPYSRTVSNFQLPHLSGVFRFPKVFRLSKVSWGQSPVKTRTLRHILRRSSRRQTVDSETINTGRNLREVCQGARRDRGKISE